MQGKKKVAIITIYSRLNYGNRLQNYAMQEILKTVNVEPFTIKNFSKFGLFRQKIDSKFKIGEQLTNKHNLFQQKREIFLKFNDKYIKTYSKDIDINDINKNYDILKDFDYFIVGSDQVWNYNIKSLSELNFLPFSNNNNKIAFAASLCVNSIPNKFKTYYKDNLSKFKAISVREYKGKRILEKLLHKEIITVIEPILMVERNEWQKIMIKPKKKINKKYILLYMISDLHINNKISKYAKKNKMDIIDINNINSKYYLTDPCEFIYLIKNAEFVITDSYHAAIFSIIFNKKCRLYKRAKEYSGMNCRVDTIKELLKIEKNSYLKNGIKCIEFMYKNDVYKNQQIIQEKINAINFLKNNLK